VSEEAQRYAARADPALRHRIFLGLYDEGVLIDPRGVGTLSTAIGDAAIEEFLAALRAVLDRVAPQVGSISRTTMLPP
jgi:hypothetical protein